MATTAATAAPADAATAAQPQAAGATITDSARASLNLAPVVVTPADVAWESPDYLEGVSAEAPPPPPAPVVSVTTSRSNTGGTTSTAAAATSTGAAESSSATSAAEAAPAPAPAPAPSSGIGASIVSIARQYVGTPYVSGGASPAGFDCSGFTQYVYAQVGISLPRTSGGQGGAGRVVSASEAVPGDLIWAPGHVGIYTGNGQHIAARNPGTPLYEGQIYMSNPTFIRVF